MTASEANVRFGKVSRVLALVTLLLLSTDSRAVSWIAAGGGGSQGNPGSRHGINVGGFTPARGEGLAVFTLLHSDDTASLFLSADLHVSRDGAVSVDPDLRLATLSIAVGNRGPDTVIDAVLYVTISPAPRAVSWSCSGRADQCPLSGAGTTVSGIALSAAESFSIDFALDFDAGQPMPEFQVSAMIESELDDPLGMDNSMTLSWTDVMFSDSFE